MSHKSRIRKYEDNEGSGPRPPVPGQESRAKKMTEGFADTSRKSPSYYNWALSLNHLLEDSDGVHLFAQYVKEEMPEYDDHLNFYFACEGLKQKTDPEEIQKLIHAIYKRFLREGNKPIPKELRDTLKASRKNKIPLSPNIYDPVQQNVEITIRDKIYPAFLCSEIYILYIQRADERCNATTGSGSGGSCSSSGASCVSGAGGGGSASSIMGACALPVTAMTGKLYNQPTTTSPFVLPTTCSSSSISESRFLGAYPPPPITSAAGACSASGSVYGPSTSASSSGSISATDTLPRSSTLPTLHEDTELITDDFKKLRTENNSGHQSAADMPAQRLTREMLLATQTRRLEVRPSGAHGYNYKPKANSSYVPNSCVDSERASVSSGGRTDSDTMSLSSCSMDGRPFRQRREKSDHDAIRQSAALNKETNQEKVIPRTLQRPIQPSLPIEKFAAELHLRLQVLKAKMEANDENDDHILEDHISRVWPGRSPGTISPRPPLPHRRTTMTTHDSGMLSDGAMSGHSMKHSKSMPDHSSSSRKVINKWPSMNTDSGISLFSSDNSMKCQASSSRSGTSTTTTTSKLEEAKRRLEEEPRRPRRSTHQMLPPPPPHTAGAGAATFSSSSSGSSTLHSQALPPLPLSMPPPPLPAKPHVPSTVVIYTFCDETVPFKATIPGTQPTLKQFKDCLPKKGNFKFYFQTHDDDPVTQKKILIQEEIKFDSDILPLLDGKVRGQVMPSE